MKKTGTLQVSPSTHIPQGRVILHPNEGFDLGLMRVKHPVQLCTDIGVQEYLKGMNGTAEDLQVELLNDCPPQTLQLNQTHWKGMGSPPRAVVLLDGVRLFFQPLSS